MSLKKYGIAEKDLLMPGSILVGAILISASIFFNTGKISSFGSGSETIAQNGQAPGSGSAIVKIEERVGEPTEGSGKVELVVFSDFQCPYCKQFFDGAYKEIKSNYIDTGKAKLVFRNYPLSFHVNAQKAAEAGECANKQGKFWQYHDTLFTKANGDGTGLAVTDLKQYAQNLGLDTSKFNSCLDNGDAADTVKKDFDAGVKAGVTGTPTIFINGKMIVGAEPFSTFQPEIEAALK